MVFKKISLILLVVMLGGILVACGGNDEDTPAAVAIVNGEEIGSEEFEFELEQFLNQYAQFGMDVSDPEMKKTG